LKISWFREIRGAKFPKQMSLFREIRSADFPKQMSLFREFRSADFPKQRRKLMKKKFVVLSTFLLLGSGCNPSSVVSSVDDAIEKDAILDSFDSKPEKKDFKDQKTVDERFEKPDELLSTLESEDEEGENSTNTVGNKDDAVEHHLLLQD
jgi:hypothetical protein